jgi:Family of unknown function (DUF5947)
MLTRTRPRRGIAALRRFVNSQPITRCELCAAPIDEERHTHLFEPANGRLLCACPLCACTLGEATDGRYRAVPDRVEALPDFRIADADWQALGLPVDIAWLVYSTPLAGPVAFYPGPAGTTQMPLAPDAWSALVAHNPILAALAPDVEALLANRMRGRRLYYRVPIDRCYELVGLIRTQWQGWSGGDEVWRAIEDYFGRLGAASGRERVA